MVMGDLKKAILDVLESAFELDGNGMMHLSGHHAVDTDTLKVLQAEYNIYFVEPNDEQVDVVC